jgi:iron complex outermembrane recepter protein
MSVKLRPVGRVALKCSAGLSALLVASAMPASAQSADESSDRADEIVVTGTLVRGIAPPGTNVIGVTSDNVKETGAASTAQLLQTIPQLGSFNSLQSPAGGFATVTTNRPNLRNLPGDRTSGSSPTLVLLDGHRIVGAGISVTSPDPDIVPPALIERVEIVPDGGSAIYGSDAVAGVINFITKKKFDGVEVGARYGFADNYNTFDANATVGRSWDTGSIFASYNYQQNDAIFGSDRDWSFSPLSIVDGIPVTSLRCGAGNVTIGNIFTGATPRSFALPFAPGTSVAGQVTQCDETDAVTLYPKQRRHSAMAGFNQELSDSLSVEIRAFYTNRVIESEAGPFRNNTNFGPTALASFGFLQGPLYAAAPKLATGTVTLPGVPFPLPASSGETQNVYYQWGGDKAQPARNDLETWGISSNWTAMLGGSWQLRALASYGESTAELHVTQPNYAAINVAAAAGLFNPYNVAASNPAALAAVGNYETYGRTRQRQFDGRVVVDGDLFALPGGAVKAAVGAELISEAFFNRNGLAVPGTAVSGYSGLVISGVPVIAAAPGLPEAKLQRTTKSVFGEIVVPIFGADNATSMIQELTDSAAGRYDHYSDVGSTFNPKFGLSWKPTEWLRFRAAWGKSFVAPSLADDPSTTQSSANFVNFTFLLPQAALVGTTVNGVVVPSFAGLAGSRGQMVVLGNAPGIDSQKATTWSLGADIDVPFAPGLRLSATYWNIDYSQIIGLPSFTSANFYQNFIGTPAVIFNPTAEQIASYYLPNTVTQGTNCGGNTPGTSPTGCYVIIDARKQNLARAKISGLDFGVTYGTATNFGGIDFALNANYELKRDQQATVTAAFIDQIAANLSRFKARATLGADIGSFRAQVSLNHSHGYNLDPAVGVGTTQTRVKSFNVVDLFFKYDVPGEGALADLSLTLNVNNAFDQDPPVYLLANSLQVQNNGFINGATLGRLVQFGVSKKF